MVTDHQPETRTLGNPTVGRPRGVNPELNLCADTSAPMLPENSLPPTYGDFDASFRALGTPVASTLRRAVHGQDCQCNIDPDSPGRTVVEMKDQCTRLYIEKSKLQVLVEPHFFFFFEFLFEFFNGPLGRRWQTKGHWCRSLHLCEHQGRSSNSASLRFRDFQADQCLRE